MVTLLALPALGLTQAVLTVAATHQVMETGLVTAAVVLGEGWVNLGVPQDLVMVTGMVIVWVWILVTVTVTVTVTPST